MTLLRKWAWAVACLVTPIFAFDTFVPGPSYSIAIPPSTLSLGKGDFFFQMKGADTYQWIGMGIGEEMADSLIFLMYSDGSGNVTVSVRDGGAGHVEPTLDTGLFNITLELQSGSGIVGGEMIANVRCIQCSDKLGPLSANTSMIAAWRTGAAIDSSDPAYSISEHDHPQGQSQFTFDLPAASVSSEANPFENSPITESTTTGVISAAQQAYINNIFIFQKAHGIIMGVTVVLLFPIGALFMRVVGNARLHGILQAFSLLCLIAGFGLGIHLTNITKNFWVPAHTRFGVALVILFLIQPILGILQHRHYHKTLSRGFFGHVHLWLGRAVLIMAIINGGLGLQLAANSRAGEIAYGVVAGIMGVIYVLVLALTGLRKGKTGARKSSDEDVSMEEMRQADGRNRVV